MKIVAVCLLCALTAGACTQSTEQQAQDVDAFVVMADGPGREVFRMGGGGCLRGPLVMFDRNGRLIFRLDVGKQWPDGCGFMQVTKD